ncbi:alpha/beta hydrolase [Streptomyces sp. NBC_00859]|uniref:alpha/beta hydrolase n=1 Tax=Streptomyces sp. NBC_00859 TaxID=2903682 RepID=UPI003869C7EE|nr:alpha/beta hydrolase [Streptomyces sp. NBC_00859]
MRALPAGWGRLHRAPVTLAVAVCLLTPAAACSSPTERRTEGSPTAAVSAGALKWGACPAPDAGTGGTPVKRDPRQRCTTVRVPLDYHAPDGRHLSIAVSRIRSGAARPRSLMTGQGGPGSSGLDLPSQDASALPSRVTRTTDLYGLDYRGIGHSAPLRCGIARADRTEAAGIPYPAADGRIDANAASARRVAAACSHHAGPGLRFFNTVNIARDIDRIRVALGLRTLSYTGISYGTFVGQVYASLFPGTSGRVLLNSVVPPGGVKAAIQNKGRGVEDAFGGFARWAAARDSTYHLGSSARAVRQTVLSTVRGLNESPLPLMTGDGLTGNLLLEAEEALLEQQGYLPGLAALLAAAHDGSVPADVTARLQFGSVFPDNFFSAQDAIVCNDSVWPKDIGGYRRAVAHSAARFPLTAGSPANIWPCAFWPVAGSDHPPKPVTHGPHNILLTQNTADPSTPLSEARRTLRAFGGRAAMVTVEATGHGVAIAEGCAGDAVADFLLSDSPARPRRCAAAR